MFSLKTASLFFALALFSCGPTRSAALLIDADVQLQAARTAGAARHATYEFTSATLYLEKAREEVGYSEYEVAVGFAQKAARFAHEAREKSIAQIRRDGAGEAPAP